MLGAYVIVKEAIGLFSGELEHALRLGAEGNLHRSGDFFPEDRPSFNLLANVLQRQVRARENTAGEPFAFANQSEQKVLCFDRNAAELARLVAGEEENSSGPFRVPFEHP